METNPYQVKMDPQAHKQLKKLANQLGITIGEMIQNLLASFQFRLTRIAEKHGAFRDTELYTEVIRLLFKIDAGEFTEEELNEFLAEISSSKKEDFWIPSVKLGPESRPVKYLSPKARARDKSLRYEIKRVEEGSRIAMSKLKTTDK